MIAVVAILVIGAALFLFSRQTTTPSSPAEVSQAPNTQTTTDTEVSESPPPGFQGKVLAGDLPYVFDFVKSDYDQALKSDNLIVLYFYANWCPICREEIPKFYEAFNEMSKDSNKYVKVIGFRVNYNDSDTDDDEKTLAREYGIAYQHTKVFIKNGQRVLKSPESWDKDRYLSEINKAL